MSHVDEWERYRNDNFQDLWEKYYRQWRAVWTAEDKQRGSERSKLISPALGQAIEATVSELEEAIFGNSSRWFDLQDDVVEEIGMRVQAGDQEAPKEGEDMFLMRDLLLEDMDRQGFRQAISEILLNAALYGTGIGKLIVEEIDDPMFVRTEGNSLGSKARKRFVVQLVPVSPTNFAIDPVAKSVNDALGCAHVTLVPLHTVQSKQADGVYFDSEVGSYDQAEDILGNAAKGEASVTSSTTQMAKIVEWHGLVPRNLMPVDVKEGEELEDVLEGTPHVLVPDETDLVEAIVTVANDGILLKAKENPYTFKDRSFLAFQLDTVPDRFWGRGIAEKGWNPQMALNAELRARSDAMALSIHPMMAIDATRMPRGAQLGVRPGRTILTQGDPRTALMPLTFGQVNPQSFPQAQDMERMIQMGTGAMDSAAGGDVNARNNTFGGMSMIAAGSVKRSKRYLRNVERFFTVPLVNKTAWRYMQFDAKRYPIVDAKFKALGSLGMVAREFETQQLTNLLKTTSADSPAYWMLIKAIYENSSIDNKEQMIKVADQFLERSLNPPPPEPDPLIEIQKQAVQVEAMKAQSNAQIQAERVKLEKARFILDAQSADSEEVKTQTEAVLNLAKAEAQEEGTQMSAYQQLLDSLLQAESQEAQVGERPGEDLRGSAGGVQDAGVATPAGGPGPTA
jgi:hypothetical protein